MRCNMDAGETRHVRLRIHSTQDDPFVIRNARYELLFGSNIVESGECTVTDHVMDVVVSPQHGNSTYRLRYIYDIADETYVDIVEIAVR